MGFEPMIVPLGVLHKGKPRASYYCLACARHRSDNLNQGPSPKLAACSMTDELSIRFHGCPNRSLLATLLENAFKKALALETRLPPEVLHLRGMSGRKYRIFINNLVGSVPNPRYLEVGCWAGSTACAAMYRNQAKITCIDNWSKFGGPRDEFFSNIDKYKNARTEFLFIERDFREVDFSTLHKHNVYFYDGPHGYQDQFDGAVVALAALDREWVFVADDWNMPHIRKGTVDGLKSHRLEPIYAIEIRSTQDDTHATVAGEHSDWHNGLFLAAIER